MIRTEMAKDGPSRLVSGASFAIGDSRLRGATMATTSLSTKVPDLPFCVRTLSDRTAKPDIVMAVLPIQSGKA